jgi:hypothetical protein
VEHHISQQAFLKSPVNKPSSPHSTHIHDIGRLTDTVAPEGTSVTIQLTGDDEASEDILERTE